MIACDYYYCFAPGVMVEVGCKGNSLIDIIISNQGFFSNAS